MMKTIQIHLGSLRILGLEEFGRRNLVESHSQESLPWKYRRSRGVAEAARKTLPIDDVGERSVVEDDRGAVGGLKISECPSRGVFASVTGGRSNVGGELANGFFDERVSGGTMLVHAFVAAEFFEVVQSEVGGLFVALTVSGATTVLATTDGARFFVIAREFIACGATDFESVDGRSGREFLIDFFDGVRRNGGGAFRAQVVDARVAFLTTSADRMIFSVALSVAGGPAVAASTESAVALVVSG